MKRRPRDIGTAAESAVVKYLHTAGFPHAERRSLRGALDAGDITGTPSVAWEVKGGDAARRASDLMILNWMAELVAEVVNAKAAVGVLVVQRAGVGPANAGRWWAYMHAFQLGALVTEVVPAPGRAIFPVRMLLADAVTLLRAAGYGDPAAAPRWTDAELDDCAFCAVRGVGPRRATGCPIHADLARPVVAPYLPAAATPEGIEDIALPGLEVAS